MNTGIYTAIWCWVSFIIYIKIEVTWEDIRPFKYDDDVFVCRPCTKSGDCFYLVNRIVPSNKRVSFPSIDANRTI